MRRIKKLEQEMLKHARNLEFEEAAKLRDEITSCASRAWDWPTTKAG